LTRAPIEPAPEDDKLTLGDAIKGMTGFEVLAIEKEFGKAFESLGGMQSLMGTVWAYENQGGKKATWADVKAMTVRQLGEYFAKSESADPTSDAGKESS
jgi:hypothetical protein